MDSSQESGFCLGSLTHIQNNVKTVSFLQVVVNELLCLPYFRALMKTIDYFVKIN